MMMMIALSQLYAVVVVVWFELVVCVCLRDLSSERASMVLAEMASMVTIGTITIIIDDIIGPMIIKFQGVLL